MIIFQLTVTWNRLQQISKWYGSFFHSVFFSPWISHFRLCDISRESVLLLLLFVCLCFVNKPQMPELYKIPFVGTSLVYAATVGTPIEPFGRWSQLFLIKHLEKDVHKGHPTSVKRAYPLAFRDTVEIPRQLLKGFSSFWPSAFETAQVAFPIHDCDNRRVDVEDRNSRKNLWKSPPPFFVRGRGGAERGRRGWRLKVLEHIWHCMCLSQSLIYWQLTFWLSCNVSLCYEELLCTIRLFFPELLRFLFSNTSTRAYPKYRYKFTRFGLFRAHAVQLL